MQFWATWGKGFTRTLFSVIICLVATLPFIKPPCLFFPGDVFEEPFALQISLEICP